MDDVDEQIYEDDFNSLNLLHLAAGLDSKYRDSIIEMLIDQGVNLNFPGTNHNVSGIRALHMAAMWGYETTVKLLLSRGANPSLRASNGYTAIDYASVYDNYSCISILLRYGGRGSKDVSTSAWSTVMDSNLDDDDEDIDDNYAGVSSDEGLYVTALDTGGDGKTNNRSHRVSPNTSARNNSRLISILSDKHDDQDDDYDPLDEVAEEELDLAIDNRLLRIELMRLGRHAGPITDTTKRLYVKLLARLRKQDREMTYSPRTTSKSKLHGYSVELTSIQTGKFAIKQALDLEKEFIRISGSKMYHGPKQFFNYILIDPRVTKNLPEQAIEASDSDTSRMASPDGQPRKPKHIMGKVNRKFNANFFTKFIEGIFYIGKGQKRRDFDHLYDALADRGSITHKKIDTIRSIWSEGSGVVSLHLFHNITDKEALTREALMIETIGLDNLTNLLRGTVQFRLGWNEHQRKLLGALLLFRAYTQYLNEGERQLRRDDLRSEQNKAK